MGIKSGLSWLASRPLLVGGIVFFGGLVVLYMMGFFGKGGGSSADSGANFGTIYSLSSSAQTQANLALKLAEVTSAGEVAKAKLAYDTTAGINKYWADTQLAKTNADNQNKLNLRALDLDYQLNDINAQNAAYQFGLNVAEFSTDENLARLIQTGFFNRN